MCCWLVVVGVVVVVVVSWSLFLRVAVVVVGVVGVMSCFLLCC